MLLILVLLLDLVLCLALVPVQGMVLVHVLVLALVLIPFRLLPRLLVSIWLIALRPHLFHLCQLPPL